MTRLAIASVVVLASCAQSKSKEAAPPRAEEPAGAAPAQTAVVPPPPTTSPTPAPDPAAAKEEARAQGLLGPTDHDLFTPLDEAGKGKPGGPDAAQRTDGGASGAAAGPHVSIGRADLEAKVELRIVQDALAKRAGEIRACYDRALASNKQVFGEISLAFTVHPDGSISNVSIKRSTVKHTELDTCVIAAISAIKLDKPLGKDAVTGSVPITFRLR